MLKLIHAAGRHAFLALDRAFNRAFGDALNPLYYLGAISYFMFWVVVVSGFYVYIFYDTGVDTTFASVERLTNAQWFAGGVMRSLHRYASDAMVLTMLLHLARHFFFDRYRGFRAFSWITGVILIWLVYVSGVNGYMLPWDQLAQYVVVTTAEWFDVLPAFRGTMVRNFTLPEAITDRLFSLLSFLHIGIPLAVLAGLWVHTQRVPRARTMPPRRFSIGLLAMLVALSLVKPAVSQGPADFSRIQQVLAIDWFYLPVYPLVTEGHAALLWWAVGGVTLLFLLLPWLPPARVGKHGWTMDVHPGNRRVPVRAGETLLDAGLRAGVPMPFECRSGGCGVCRATVVNGTIDPGPYQPSALPEEARARGEVLLCCACALSDVEVELEAGAALRERAVPLFDATVSRLDKLAYDVMLVELTLDEGQSITYEAGQYINVLLDDGARRSYSFTEPSATTGRIPLHVRLVPGGRFSTRVFEAMRVGDRLRIEGPLGEFILHEPTDKPLIFVAGATGFAPVKSLLEQAFRLGIARPLHLYWGVRQRRDLYLAELPERWAREHANFRFVPVLSDARPEDDWQGRTGLVHQAILADFPNLSGCAIYACGSVQMIQTAKPAFVAQGLAEDFCFSDAFTPQSAPPKP
ncbi:MAG: cytochrome b N-terminal domain-containing protein [Burkholderiales bacterium]|jgi:NAD(P)H-flavin reductase/quinol-cytochrome oxidoreductase complex cytochrome b subunit|nr:cytochrome b N-terminal domain-containing protein [Burkholderiales bacterium]